jgi:hypothetical protein
VSAEFSGQAFEAEIGDLKLQNAETNGFKTLIHLYVTKHRLYANGHSSQCKIWISEKEASNSLSLENTMHNSDSEKLNS